MERLDGPLRAAEAVAVRHGATTDRRVILQDGHTLVARLSETLVARVVTDRDGPRQGGEWFAREIAVAEFLARRGAPVIPVHDAIPPGPHEEGGYALNFWRYVEVLKTEPAPVNVGLTLRQCHQELRGFEGNLPELAILHETLALLDAAPEGVWEESERALLRRHLEEGLERMAEAPAQALHGDAHGGNLLVTTDGLLWTDWEDAFRGPVEWDLASILWNARWLEEDEAWVEEVLAGYAVAGGSWDEGLLEACYSARAAVMSTWYPVLYPQANAERRAKLEARLAWLVGR